MPEPERTSLPPVLTVRELYPVAGQSWQLPVLQGQVVGVQVVGLSQGIGFGSDGQGQ